MTENNENLFPISDTVTRRSFVASAVSSASVAVVSGAFNGPACAAEGVPTVGQWEVFEVVMIAGTTFLHPYVESMPDDGKAYVHVTFTGTEGEACGRNYTVAGFWDGGNNWKARFAPPLSGTWSYSSTSADRGLHGLHGHLRSVRWSEADKDTHPNYRGFVRVACSGPRPGRHFEYADGTPFLWIGDTWWSFAKRGFPFERAKQVIDDRSSKGFTVGQVQFGANNPSSLAGSDYQTPDLYAIRAAEQVIAYANSKGMTLWISAWWSGAKLKEAGPQKIRRWWRYLIQRLAAYNLIWNVACEYNMNDYGGLGLQFWKDIGHLIRKEDPYGHAIGVHNTPPGWPAGDMGHSQQWSTGDVLLQEPWLDFMDSQTGHGKWRNELVPQIISSDYRRVPRKPTLISETWYEFIEGNAPAMDIRFAAWSAILSGAAGHTYGGGHQWYGGIPRPGSNSVSPAGLELWPQPPLSVDSLSFPGAASIGFMAKFLRGIDWWRLEPHPEVISEYSQPLAAAVLRETYLVYARYGGRLKLDLSAAAVSDLFRFTWIDLVELKESSGTVNGGDVRVFQVPEEFPKERDYKDWLLLVTHVR